MTPTPQAAAVLRSRRFSLCRIDPAEKKPTYKGWSTRSLEPADFAAGDMLGIMGGPLSSGGKTGHALIIIDLDTPDAVQLADNFLPATGMIEGRAGKPRSHRYYLVPFDSIPTWARSTAKQGAPAAESATGHAGPFKKQFRHRETKACVIDFIGTGGQCVCPPSAHPTGELREWEGGTPGEPGVIGFTDLWRVVCELAVACGCAIPDVIPRPPRGRVRLAPTPVVDRARKYLAKMPEAVAGAAGHAATFTAARALVWGFDLPQDDAFRILAEVYNPRCVPPWSDAELRHKIESADRVPSVQPRGYLRDAERPERNSTPSRNGTHHTEASGSPPPPPPAPLSAVAVIVGYFRGRYRPDFRRSNAIHTATGEFVPMGVACEVPTSKLIDALADASDAPKYKGGAVNRDALPALFKKWSKVAWGDLLDSLPDEDTAPLGADSTAADEFCRLVRQALLFEIVIESRERDQPNRYEKLSLIDWCHRFAKDGPWRTIRSKKCWCKTVVLPGGEIRLRVAVRHELFAQVKADRRLCEMGSNTFTRRAARYGVGSVSREERPHGLSAVVLSDEFVADLIAGLPDDSEDTAENLADGEKAKCTPDG